MRAIMALALLFTCVLSINARAETVPFICDNDWLPAEIGRQIYEGNKTPLEALRYVNDAKYRLEDYAGGVCVAMHYEGEDTGLTKVMRFKNGQEYMVARVEISRLFVQRPGGVLMLAFPQPIVRYMLALPADDSISFVQDRQSI